MSEVEEEIDEEMSAKDFAKAWFQNISSLLVVGEPFFNAGVLDFTFNTENEIFLVKATRKPNNIIPFPKKQEPEPLKRV